MVCLKTAKKLSDVDCRNNNPTQKLATFTKTRKGIGYITKLFKQYLICLQENQSFKCNLNLQQTDHSTEKWLSGGVYKLICLDCYKAHVGQTGRASQRGSKNTSFYFIHNIFNSIFAERLSIIWPFFRQNGKHHANP